MPMVNGVITVEGGPLAGTRVPLDDASLWIYAQPDREGYLLARGPGMGRARIYYDAALVELLRRVRKAS